jgi:hypothetical protein
MESAALFSAASRRHLASTIAAMAMDTDASASSNPILPSGRNTMLDLPESLDLKIRMKCSYKGMEGKHDEEGKH